jgi:hypothetical protein
MKAAHILMFVTASWLSTASAFYNPESGRWLNRDPIKESGGPDVYAAVANDAINSVDKCGLFKVWTHQALVERNIQTFYNRHRSLQLNSRCWDDIRIVLAGADADQDVSHLDENSRHYNSDRGQNKGDAELLYMNYTQGELARFNSAVHRKRCFEALESLGLLSHSWQDFFAHAIRRDGRGGRENSTVPGWTAFSVGVMGTPEAVQNFWPSSYYGALSRDVGEHPRWEEPVDHGSAEGEARQREALIYVASKYESLLTKWIEECNCHCNSGALREGR